jgi:hypothetical protein
MLLNVLHIQDKVSTYDAPQILKTPRTMAPRVRTKWRPAGVQRHTVKKADSPRTKVPHKLFKGGFFVFFLFMYDIQHCFICRPSDSTVPEDAVIEHEESCVYGTGCQTL